MPWLEVDSHWLFSLGEFILSNSLLFVSKVSYSIVIHYVTHYAMQFHESLAGNRAHRYGQDDAQLVALSPTMATSTLRTFYGGDAVTLRMDQIRRAIVEVRKNWHQYDTMMQQLAMFIERTLLASKQRLSPASSILLARIRAKRFDWIDEIADANGRKSAAENTDLLKFYTSDDGYKLIFKLIYDEIFRRDAAIENFDSILSAVFLVELINIQLYNLCVVNPKYANFSGTVYRGMRVTDDVITAHEQLITRPVAERYIAIPLALQSYSKSYSKAMQFASGAAKTAQSDCNKRMLVRIQVFPMLDHLLQDYKKYFQTSVVSTICAVSIEDFSEFPQEQEVILRGPFYQMLKFEKHADPSFPDDPLWILDGLTLQANRDHISTYRLGNKDALARQFFGLIAKISRCTYAMKFCKDNYLSSDADAYSLMLNNAYDELNSLRNQCEQQSP